MKHIIIKYHFLCKAEAHQKISLKYRKTIEQHADMIFTKALPRAQFELLEDLNGVKKKMHQRGVLKVKFFKRV